MNDHELCKLFGTTLEEVEIDVTKYEAGDFSDIEFSDPIEGRPDSRMKTTSVKFYDFELAAIDRAAEKEGISRSAFIRKACDSKLIEIA